MPPTHAYSWTVVIPSPSRLENHVVVQELRIFASLPMRKRTSAPLTAMSASEPLPVHRKKKVPPDGNVGQGKYVQLDRGRAG